MNIIRKPLRYSHTEGHTDVCYSDDGKYIVTCGSDGDIRVWCGIEDDDPSSQCVGEKAFAVAYKGKKLFVATDNNNVQAYTFPELEKDGVISNFTAPVTHIIATENSKIISGSCDMTIQIHDASTNNFESLSGHSAPILGIAVDPASQFLASSSCDGTIRIWSLDTLKCVKIWSCLPVCNSFYLARCLGRTSWYPLSGKLIAIPDGLTIDLYEKNTWEKTKSLSNNDVEKPFSIALFSPCGKYLVGGTIMGEICIWDVSSSVILSYTKHHRGYAICSMAWNPSRDGTIAFCDVSGQLGTVEGCVGSDVGEEQPTTDRGEFKMVFDEEDDDGENVISLEKIKSSICQPMNDILGLNLEDGDDAKDDDEESKVSFAEPVLKLQSPFQPTSTPVHLQHRYMVWNSVGIIRCFNTEEENSIDVEFHDSTLHHAIHMNNYLKHTLASLSEKVLALSCEADNENPSKIVCVLLNSWDGSRDWNINLPEREEVLAIACSNTWVAAASDIRNLRFFTITGTQREIISLPGPVVCLAAHDSLLFVIYHHGSGLNFALLSVGRFGIQTLIHFQPVPLTPNSTVQWAGFSDEGTPCIMDSAGMLRIFAVKGFWQPLCDTQTLCKGKSDHYFILGISEKHQNIRCILCKGSHYPATTPRPTVVEIPFKIPMCEPDNERSQLEEKFWRSQTIFNSLDSLCQDDMNYNYEKQEVEKTIKETIIKLFALACKSDLDQRALELCKMMPSVQIVQLAKKYASKVGKIQLVRRIDETILQNSSDDSFFSEETSSRFTLNKSLLSLHNKESQESKKEDPDDVDPFASSQSQEISSDKENILLAIKKKMNSLASTTSSVSQKRVNPFKKTPKANNSSINNSVNSGIDTNLEDGVENNTTSASSTIMKVKQTGLWGKTLNTAAAPGKMTFVSWFNKEKESLQEEFPNEDAASLTRIAMKRFKETVLNKGTRSQSNEGSQNAQEYSIKQCTSDEIKNTIEVHEDEADVRKRKLDGDIKDLSSASKLAKFAFKK